MSLADKYLDKIYPRVSEFRGSTWIGRKLVEKSFPEICFTSNPCYTAFLKEPGFMREFEQAVNQDSVVCDVGSFHGAYSILGLKGSLVHCFEMDEKNLTDLKRNLEANRNLGAYKVNNKAVSDSNGTVEADIDSNPTSSLAGTGDTVESITLDSYLEERIDPDVLKINVEGAEMQVLEGGRKVLNRSHPKLFLEFHKEKIYDYDDSPKQLEDFLQHSGYIFSKTFDRGSQVLVVAK